MTNLWHEKPIRSIFDPTTGGYWFSVIDLFAQLTDSDHKAASGYWRTLKHNKTKTQVVTESNYLKMKSPDGKYHFTEVVDFKNLIRLIQTCPSQKANSYRLWFADVVLQGISANDMEMELAKLGAQSATEIVEKYENDPKQQYVRLVTQKEVII